MPAALLLPVLRRLGRLGRRRPDAVAAGSTSSSSSAPARCGRAASFTRRSSAPLLALRDGHASSEASLIEDTVRQMREGAGRTRASGSTGEHPEADRPLFEHEYGVPASSDTSGRRSATTWSAACGTSTGCRCRRDQADADRALGSSRTSAPFPGRARARSRRPTSATGASRPPRSSWTGRPEARARAPGSPRSAATRSYALEVLRVELGRVDLLGCQPNLREGKVTEPSLDEGEPDRGPRAHSRLRCAR